METPNQGQQEAQPIEVVCPHCKKSFLHTIGHAIKEGAEAAADAAVNIAAKGAQIGGDE